MIMNGSYFILLLQTFGIYNIQIMIFIQNSNYVIFIQYWRDCCPWVMIPTDHRLWHNKAACVAASWCCDELGYSATDNTMCYWVIMRWRWVGCLLLRIIWKVWARLWESDLEFDLWVMALWDCVLLVVIKPKLCYIFYIN